MIITNTISNVNNAHSEHFFQNTFFTSLQENLRIIKEIAHAERSEDFSMISVLTEKLHPDFKQRLGHYISRVGFLSRPMILQIQTEICLELLLEAIRINDEGIDELLDQFMQIQPRNKELYKLLAEVCHQASDPETWGKLAFQGPTGYYANLSEKEQAISKFKILLQESWEKELLTSNFTPISLEKEFENQGGFDVGPFHKDCSSKNDLGLDEGHLRNFTPHLIASQTQPGIVVCRGGERPFFDLMVSHEKTCHGVVGRDKNPKVKAYVDFNTALLRISKTVQEYAELSGCTIGPDGENLLDKRIKIIESKLEMSDLSAKIKKYYLENIHRFGEIYFNAGFWQNGQIDSKSFDCCRYDQDESLFLKLKRYADSGNIVCIIGDFDDLVFLKNRKVTAIHMSNIQNYSCLDFKGAGNFQPRIIWMAYWSDAKYYSRIFKPLSETERIEFDELINQVKDSGIQTEEGMHNFLFMALSPGCNAKSSSYTMYSVETLNALRVYVKENFLKLPRLGVVNVGLSGNGAKKLNALSMEEIHELCQNPETKHFVGRLVAMWTTLDLPRYVAFSQIEGWKEQFEVEFAKPHHSLTILLDKLKQQNLLEEFILEFGQERLDRLVALATKKS